MKVKKEFWLILGIVAFVAFVLWCILISICVVDLYTIQEHMIDSLIVVQDSLNDLYDYILEPFRATQVSLSDETKGLVEDLRTKHYGLGTFYCSDAMIADFVYDWWGMTFEDGILYIETQNGEWFIEMKRKED